MNQWWLGVYYDGCHDVVICLSFMWNVISELYCFLEVIVIDVDYDDDFSDDNFLMMMNSYMQSVDVIDDEMHVWKMMTLMKTICWVNVCIIESYVHAFITRIFISNEDD